MANRSLDLERTANWVWRETIRIHRESPETRLASSLSSVEIFVALYYGKVLNFDPTNPLIPTRDRCIVSKGHGSICLYPILADLGFFDKGELERVGREGGILGGIPDPVIPGYETINGSLGHGLGVAAGIALALKRMGKKESVFVLVGDGELHEGANWEAIMFAAQHCLDNLNVIVDDNRISMLGFTDDIVSHRSLVAKFESFAWSATQRDGHDVRALVDVLTHMKLSREHRPKVLVARTVKGRGVPGLENQPLAHILNPPADVLDKILEHTR